MIIKRGNKGVIRKLIKYIIFGYVVKKEGKCFLKTLENSCFSSDVSKKVGGGSPLVLGLFE
ncbi:hypothetical protein J2S78_001327 [Salibacterium salarium]|nr:hypothetical protein [Salibacterium salarium]